MICHGCCQRRRCCGCEDGGEGGADVEEVDAVAAAAAAAAAAGDGDGAAPSRPGVIGSDCATP